MQTDPRTRAPTTIPITGGVADATAVARAWSRHRTRDLAGMCQDAWRFQRFNPDGYVRRQSARDRRIGAAI
jgi:hypothetical protein